MKFILGYLESCLVRLVLVAATAGPAATRTETAESSAGFAEKIPSNLQLFLEV